MIVRLKVKEAVLDVGNGTICGNSDVLDLSGLAVKVTVDNVVVLDSADINVAAPVSVALTGKTFYYGGVINGLPSFKIVYADDGITDDFYNILNESSFGLTLSKTGYISYSNVFTLYNYDYGNDAALVYNNGDPIVDNTPFEIHLIREVDTIVNSLETLPYSAFIAYRKPFTDSIHVYCAVGTDLTVSYINQVTNAVLNTGKNFIINNSADIIIQQKVTIDLLICTSDLTIPKLLWKPEVTLSVTTVCPTGCISIFDVNVGKVELNTNDVAVLATEDYLQKTARHLTLEYGLFDSNNLLINGALFPFEDLPVTTYNSTDTQFEFQPDILGDYKLKACLSVYGSNGTVISTGFLTANTWYRIKTGQDFSSYDAPFNTVGTVFNTLLNEVTVDIWTGGELWELSPFSTCCKTLNLKGCNWISIVKGTCPNYVLTNYKGVSATVTIAKLVGGVFIEVNEQIIAANDSFDLDLEDGVYSITFVATGLDEPEVTSVIVVDCNLISCYSTYFKAIMCADKEPCCKDCGDSVKQKKLDMINLIVLISTFYTLAAPYSPNTIITITDDTILTDLYQIDDVVTKIQQYCIDCDNEDCEGCK